MYIQYLNGGHPVDMKLLQSESTLSEAISSLGCRRNSSSGSMLIRQLTEVQFCSHVHVR